MTALFVPDLGGGRRKRERDRVAFHKGEAVTFEGLVIGEPPYCRPSYGFLHASRTSLCTSPTKEVETLRRPLPLDRLELVRVRSRQKSDPRGIRPYFEVAECRDGGAEVLIVCAPEHMAYVREALGGGFGGFH
ncbi:hypothetical protein [Kitasatospora sp. NPDC088351]|uniref:hypothetical protein n=1 Tax=unclassified Kitasatospora TaxID=2633591 RepID=UPI0034475DCF